MKKLNLYGFFFFADVDNRALVSGDLLYLAFTERVLFDFSFGKRRIGARFFFLVEFHVNFIRRRLKR